MSELILRQAKKLQQPGFAGLRLIRPRQFSEPFFDRLVVDHAEASAQLGHGRIGRCIDQICPQRGFWSVLRVDSVSVRSAETSARCMVLPSSNFEEYCSNFLAAETMSLFLRA